RNPHSSQALARQSVPADLPPMLAAICRTIQTGPRPLRGWVNTPRRPAGLQQSGVNYFRVSRLKRQIDRAGIFIVEQQALPFLSAVLRIKNAAFRIRSVRVSQRGHKNALRVPRVDQNPRNLPRILQTDVRPSLPAIRGPV